jgi:hypothetical protein
VTDTTLRQVYMGESSVRARLPNQREDGELPIFNSLDDLLAIPDLVIIRVGFVVYFNRAMASILQEALMLRDGIGKPTWIVEPAGYYFKPWSKNEHGIPSGMPCCNDDVAQFVEDHFDSLQLGEAEPPTEEHDGEVTARGIPDTEEQTEEETPTEADEETEGTPDEDQPMIDALTKRKTPKSRRR